jgi:large repetitive protein
VNGADDEDGVAFLNATAAGQIIGLGITASAGGYVDAWCDYNRNGSWLDGNEQIFNRLPVHAGSNYVTVLLPPSLTPGASCWRFRISSTGGLAPTGFAAGGEVEDYVTTLLPNPNSGGNTNAGVGHIDWGDAPAAYPVLAADYGASHRINDGLCLGASVDAETNGQPHLNALGDDLNVDDEDGVAFGALVRSTNIIVLSTAQVNVTGQGYLNAWIDFNGDGDWDDAGEQIATSEFMTFGGNPNAVTFRVPASAVPGTTFARFRFGVDAAVPPTGGAGEGEVEDYKVNITTP